MDMRGSHESDVAVAGPQDVDAPGELAPKVVKAQMAHELIKQVRANYPVDLVNLEQRDEDRPRTAALLEDEVLEETQDEFGDGDEKGGVVKILSARVRGRNQPLSEKAVCVLWETPSGRTARGAIPYTTFDESITNFDEKVSSGEITEVDETDAKDLTRTVERQQEQIKRLNAQISSGASGDPAEAAGLTPEDVKQMIAEVLPADAAEAISDRDEEIERLKAELAEKEDGAEGAGDGQPEHPETEDLASQDAADAASATEAEAAGSAEAPESGDETPPEPVEAPQGKAKALVDQARAGEFSAEQLDALIAEEKKGDPPRKSVIEAAELAKKKLESGD